MPLSADRGLNVAYDGAGVINDLPIGVSTTVYQGAFVGLTAGNARGLVAGDPFMGINVLNRAAGTSVGGTDTTVRVVTKGVLKGVTITGASAATDVGKQVYASADDTLTLTISGNSFVGRIRRFDTATSTFDVYFEAATDLGNTA